MYDALIFVPAGMFLGMIGRKVSWRNPAGRFLWLLGFLLPSALYEFILVWVSGRAVSLWQVSPCLFLTFLGAWLVNADCSDGILSRNSRFFSNRIVLWRLENCWFEKCRV
jgi:hypothetical protein